MRFAWLVGSRPPARPVSFISSIRRQQDLRKGFDQIVHFAAIKTDNDLVETDRFETRSRLLPYVVPNPAALRLSGLSIERLSDKQLPTHCEMVAKSSAP